VSHAARRRLLGAIALALVALVALASGTPGLELAEGRPIGIALQFGDAGGGSGMRGGGLLVTLIVGSVWLSLVLVIVGAIVSPRFRGWLWRTLPPYALLLAALLLVLSLWQPEPGGGAMPGDATPPAPAVAAPAAVPFPAPPELVRRPPAWLSPLLTIVLGGVLAALVWRLSGRIERVAPAGDAITRRVAAQADAAAAALAAGADVRDAVIQCYQAMEQLVRSERGIVRDLALTPREFEQQLVMRGIDATAIAQLVRLFERVRYGAQASDAHLAQQARDCFAAIAQSTARRP
jgi:hypothetical protein